MLSASRFQPNTLGEPSAIPIYAAVFAVMTAIWCGLGWLLVNNRVLGAHLRRYGHLLLPFVLIGLGLYILSGDLVLFQETKTDAPATSVAAGAWKFRRREMEIVRSRLAARRPRR